ncbi:MULTISPECIES: hypothetical protein [Burkholderia]|uniref:hypothetical protein n=1 Tax=Burkholderia TaxID=32008 RepID=UPI000863A826|nr:MULTISPECIES: hypothetical protein [Burkholderia]AOL07468.1 hypothetical protein WI95_26690 [Burkholderia contaminans]MCA7883002.1 hypothetical protein [Burkholderia contaminans]TCW67946.1 hypothetical protein C5O79_19700 [Burkholderia sp. SRS-25]
MSFRWNPQFPSERATYEPLPLWFYLLLYLIVEGSALALVVPGLPKYGSIPWDRVLHYAVAVPFFGWLALSCIVYWFAYDIPATQAAEHNSARWHQMTGWQRKSRSGMAVLDSTILTPEPDLAERMLALEGEPPENPGRVMALGEIDAADDGSRLNSVLDALLTPMAARLAQAAKGGSFEIVMQCDYAALSREVLTAWGRLELPGKPVVRWLDNSREVGFADTWFESNASYLPYHSQDTTPKYRLVLAWRLNTSGPDTELKDSEAAVALLLGSPALMCEKPDLKHQAWLLRQITGDADRVEGSLALLLKAGQVPVERIRHFWHSRLKGLAQHATLGAVRESDLKVDTHALDLAIGPQAPVARWVIQALAAKMAHFGQGPQLIALPHEQGVVLNLVAREPDPVDVPWKDEYGYRPILGPEFGALTSLWMVSILLSADTGWSSTDTLVTCVTIVLMVVFFFIRHPGLFSRLVESTVDLVASIIG